MTDDPRDEDVETTTSTASTLFDLRTVIALLFGSYGVLLLVVAILDTSQDELDKAGGIHLNLWTSIAMIVASVLFLVWVRLRPPLVGSAEHEDESTP